jgi:pSer/pThr/pTyr-binding forkhead associated (FHA) protein
MSELLLILRVMMVIMLYAFLGWALLTLWRDLKHQREILSAQKTPSIELEIQIGDTLQKQKYHGPEITIGRNPSCECSLDSGTVSANHSRISFYKNQWWVEDLESTNGTFLNSEQVSAPTVIAHNDQLRCGEVLLTILSES